MTDSPATVIVIDDDPDVRGALHDLLETVGLTTVLYDSPTQFLASKRPHGPYCIVLDVRMPGQSGLDVQAQLVQENVFAPVIFLTGYADVSTTVRAMKAGAAEFLTKPFRDQDVIDAVQAALRADSERRSEARRLEELRARHATLTPREQQVMQLLAAGRVSKQIAADMGISEVTIRVHRVQLMRKIGANSIADLVRIADQLKA
jgi:FixJ family two-component response regulator